MDQANLIALAGVVIASLVAFGTMYRFVTSTSEDVRREMTALVLKATETARERCAGLERDIKDLERDTVRRREWDGLDARFTRMETKLDGMPDKLTALVEAALRRMAGGH